MGENNRSFHHQRQSLQRISKLGLIAYATLMLIPIFNHNAGIHQWDIQVINLIKWTKVCYTFFDNIYLESNYRLC